MWRLVRVVREGYHEALPVPAGYPRLLAPGAGPADVLDVLMDDPEDRSSLLAAALKSMLATAPLAAAFEAALAAGRDRATDVGQGRAVARALEAIGSAATQRLAEWTRLPRQGPQAAELRARWAALAAEEGVLEASRRAVREHVDEALEAGRPLPLRSRGLAELLPLLEALPAPGGWGASPAARARHEIAARFRSLLAHATRRVPALHLAPAELAALQTALDVQTRRGRAATQLADLATISPWSAGDAQRAVDALVVLGGASETLSAGVVESVLAVRDSPSAGQAGPWKRDLDTSIRALVLRARRAEHLPAGLRARLRWETP